MMAPLSCVSSTMARGFHPIWKAASSIRSLRRSRSGRGPDSGSTSAAASFARTTAKSQSRRGPGEPSSSSRFRSSARRMDDRSLIVAEPPNLGTPLEVPDLVDRLAAHRRIGSAPRHELEWLAAHGNLRHFAAGDLFGKAGDLLEYMIVMLTGHGGVYINRGRGRQRAMDWQGGDVTGAFP